MTRSLEGDCYRYSSENLPSGLGTEISIWCPKSDFGTVVTPDLEELKMDCRWFITARKRLAEPNAPGITILISTLYEWNKIAQNNSQAFAMRMLEEVCYREGRARRQGKPLQYAEHPLTENQLLLVNASNALDRSRMILDNTIQHLLLAPGVAADASTIDVVANAGAGFRHGLRSFVAGDRGRTFTIDITDAGVEKLVQACPNLTTVILHGTHNLRDKALPGILKRCADIETVTLTVAKQRVSKRTRLTGFIE
ncbi:hypothetical protein K458DRAFT_433160 [Lentithecium fluviatile CBS 122367]|uniref:Uncharacterized protein n=1 Tax=Lentithecium fluviatile CBS 122367 TaxID=1168545 RepID=A0A6G1IW32_9PLEO|nr:hypothetical protein K458DRAFT_433160 [Lentithecium fluviatile CBS 122367]